MVFLLVAGPLTEVIGYKTMIIIEVVMHVATYSILIWGTVRISSPPLCGLLFLTNHTLWTSRLG